MKKRLQGLIAGVLICVMLPCGVAFAKQATEAIKVTYNNIKILIDGKEYQPTDVNGNVVEPFIYNGTTYLPVRAIANAFDKEVDWEAQTSTVTLGSKNYDWLDQMGYVDYSYTGIANQYKPIGKKTKMTDGLTFDRGLMFSLNDCSEGGKVGTIVNNDGTMECSLFLSYLTNSNYKTFEGEISHFDDNYSYGSAIIKFYGDGNLLYTSPIVAKDMKTTKFNVNIEGVKLLKISVERSNIEGKRNIYSYVYPCIADARLSKK